jgi:ABC-type branched-subunit amino acid transport system ATPase component
VLGFQELLGGFAEYSGIAFGLLLIIVATIAPGGMASLLYKVIANVLERRKSRRSSAPTPVARAQVDSTDDPRRWDALRVVARPLTVVGISRAFGGVQALNEADLVVRPGMVHAIVGPNGSGKTTLLNLISGYVKADAGTVHLGESRVDRKTPARRTSAGIARTFQTPKLSANDSALANVVLGADRIAKGSIASSILGLRAGRRDDRAAVEAATHALDLVGLIEFKDVPAGNLSHGIQRLLEIARVIAMRPEVVLLDEPAAGLSPAETVVLISTVKALAAAGLGVVLVEHNLPVVYGVADEVTVLDQGSVLAHGTPSEVASDPRVISVYLGRRETAVRERLLQTSEL